MSYLLTLIYLYYLLVFPSHNYLCSHVTKNRALLCDSYNGLKKYKIIALTI